MSVIERQAGVDQKVSIPKKVAVIGARGQTGELYTEVLVGIGGVDVLQVIRPKNRGTDITDTKSGIYPDIETMLQQEQPEVVFLATPNPADDALRDIARFAPTSLTVVLPQNGVDVADKAKKIFADSPIQHELVRASLCTVASSTSDGQRVNSKRRVGLASIDGSSESVEVVANLFSLAGFEVRIGEDHRSMAWSKLVTNLVGATSVITGLPPLEAFLDPQIFALELKALKDRLQILKAADIDLDHNLWGIRQLELLAKLPEFIALRLKAPIAKAIASARENQLPAAARKIGEGARVVEATTYYHKAFMDLAKEYGLNSPVDEAIYHISTWHARPNKFDLNSLTKDEKKSVLFKAVDMVTRPVFVESSPAVNRLVGKLHSHYTRKLEIAGGENLNQVAGVLESGKSVLFTVNHRSHADHSLMSEALSHSLGEIAGKYPVYFVAGMKLDQEWLARTLQRAYPHLVVATLKSDDSDTDRLMAHIINTRAKKVIEELHRKSPSIFIVYPEGGRSKEVDDRGNPILQRGAEGFSAWVLNPHIGLVIPTALTGTEQMLLPGSTLPHRADLTVTFGRSLESAALIKEGAQIPRLQRDQYYSDRILQEIAANLPSDQRGYYHQLNLG